MASPERPPLPGGAEFATMFKMNQNYMVLIWYLIIVIIMIYLFVFSQ